MLRVTSNVWNLTIEWGTPLNYYPELLENIRLGWKHMPKTNALAYFATTSRSKKLRKKVFWRLRADKRKRGSFKDWKIAKLYFFLIYVFSWPFSRGAEQNIWTPKLLIFPSVSWVLYQLCYCCWQVVKIINFIKSK